MADKKVKQWITINGVHVPIYEGESKDDAVKRAINRGSENAKNNEDLKEKQIAKNKAQKDELNGKKAASKSEYPTTSKGWGKYIQDTIFKEYPNHIDMKEFQEDLKSEEGVEEWMDTLEDNGMSKEVVAAFKDFVNKKANVNNASKLSAEIKDYYDDLRQDFKMAEDDEELEEIVYSAKENIAEFEKEAGSQEIKALKALKQLVSEYDKKDTDYANKIKEAYKNAWDKKGDYATIEKLKKESGLSNRELAGIKNDANDEYEMAKREGQNNKVNDKQDVSYKGSGKVIDEERGKKESTKTSLGRKAVKLDNLTLEAEKLAKDLPQDRFAKETRKKYVENVYYSYARELKPIGHTDADGKLKVYGDDSKNEMYLETKYISSALQGNLSGWYANEIKIDTYAPRDWRLEVEKMVDNKFKAAYTLTDVPSSFAANYPNMSGSQLLRKYNAYLKKNKK